MPSVESAHDAFHWMPLKGQLRRRTQTLSYGSVSLLLFPAGRELPTGLAKSTPSEPIQADWRPVVKLKALSNHENSHGEGVLCYGRGTGALTNHHGDTEARTQALCPPVVPGEVGGAHGLLPSCRPSSGCG